MMDQTSTNPTNYIITSQQQQPQQQQTINNGQQPSNQMIVQQSPNNLQQHTEVQRKQFIQKQLVLLLHAHKCQQREKQTINGETSRSTACTLPHCSTMKNVLQHMTKCNDHKTCVVPHCVTSRQIILHWKQCNNSQCPICQPLKTPSTLAKLNQTNTIPTNNTNISATSNPINKEWQRRVTQEMRNHLVQKIITALIPITDTGAMRDKRIINLANYARRVENETFEIANNQEEYFHKLAEKIYKIQKELEDRREKKRLQDMQLTASSTGQTSTNDYKTIDTMAGDHGPPNRIAPLHDFAPSSMPLNLLPQSIKPEPIMTQTNRPMTNSTAGTFTITNVPQNDKLNYLLNGNQTHEIDMIDSSRNSLDQFKNEPLSPKPSYQV
jgi:hypothetical protein